MKQLCYGCGYVAESGSALDMRLKPLALAALRCGWRDARIVCGGVYVSRIAAFPYTILTLLCISALSKVKIGVSCC